MKKWIALFVSIILIFSLAACGNSGQSSENTSAQSQELIATSDSETSSILEETPVPSKQVEENESTGGKTLVVYYSATGNTKEAANLIAEATDADVFEVEPVEPYSAADLDWTDDNSRVVYEHDNPKARVVELVAVTVSDWESYDTVFIGYPIWWGIAAWPVNGLVEGNDFTGKTVIPFCTSSTSDLGESGQLLAELAGTGDRKSVV